MKVIVLKLSGKFFDDATLKDYESLKSIVRELTSRGVRVAIVTGGGSIARRYIKIGRELGINEGLLDLLGIHSARLNAYLLSFYLSELSVKRVPETLDEFLELWSLGKIVIAGGFQPGQSTNAVSALVAEAINADILINLTNVDGVYDKDPKKYSNAKLLERVYYDELEKILAENQSYSAGAYELLDPLSVKILSRSRIKALIMSYQNLDRLVEIIDGRVRLGSIVLPR